ncbi:MAG: FadR/GntR family transcriptional regulator [Roseiarcus sp.]|jgi:DNA-binding FadR family transcriptional regulator|uniref:FadR/GntR family transcriptional regulator n=1 Tax=Roseiarcus sp. TaxID=1969460 RepID=UPI003C1FEBE2
MARATRHSPSGEAAIRRRASRRPAAPATRETEGRAPTRRSDAQLAARLGRDIVNGVFPAGSLLPSAAEMGARFSASRTALREAYSKLSGKGLIVARPRIGTRVRLKADWNLLDPDVLAWRLSSEPDGHFVDDLFTLRRAIEPMAAELAATSRTPDSLARIAGAFGRMEQFKNGDGDLIGADVDFHLAILDATGNHFLAALGGIIQAALECSFRFTWIGAASIRDDRLEQHRGILAAISDGAPEPARARMVELLNDSFDDMRKFHESRSRATPSAPRRGLAT